MRISIAFAAFLATVVTAAPVAQPDNGTSDVAAAVRAVTGDDMTSTTHDTKRDAVVGMASALDARQGPRPPVRAGGANGNRPAGGPGGPGPRPHPRSENDVEEISELEARQGPRPPVRAGGGRAGGGPGGPGGPGGRGPPQPRSEETEEVSEEDDAEENYDAGEIEAREPQGPRPPVRAGGGRAGGGPGGPPGGRGPHP